MREILFRGKRKDGLWLYGHYADENVCETDFCCIVPLRSMGEYVNWSVSAKTVGQYTSLIDNNGKKIFEGDIIKTQDEMFVIGYNERLGGFVAYESKDRIAWEFIDEIGKIEIIGNIHDNPELLKGADQE